MKLKIKIKVKFLGYQETVSGKDLILVNDRDNNTVVYNSDMHIIIDAERL